MKAKFIPYSLVFLVGIVVSTSCSKPQNSASSISDSATATERAEPILRSSQIKTNRDVLEYTVNVRIPEQIGENLGISNPDKIKEVTDYLLSASKEELPQVRVELDELYYNKDRVNTLMELLTERYEIIEILEE